MRRDMLVSPFYLNWHDDNVLAFLDKQLYVGCRPSSGVV